MDISINKVEFLEWIREKCNSEKIPYKKVKGKSGKTWIYGHNANHIFVEADKRELAPDYDGFKGFGGRTITFDMVDGTQESLKAPWQSNADALFYDTGVDLRNKHWSMCIISKGREPDPYNLGHYGVAKDVIHLDKGPVLGEFHRGTKLAMRIAKELGDKVYCFNFTSSGCGSGPVYPDQIDVNGKRRGF